MREKPTISRYYRNIKTGQYCHLEGSRMAINEVEKTEWAIQKVITKRIPKREFEANKPRILLGYSITMHPHRDAQKAIRENRKTDFIKFSMCYFPL